VKWYFDTSVFVAAAVTTHPHHGPAIAVLKELLSDGHRGLVSAHSLMEVYSVLTRTPFPRRLSATQVMASVESLILKPMELVALTGAEYEAIVRNCAANGWGGGRVFDAVHVACAAKSACDRLYTFNVQDFVALSPLDLAQKVMLPSG
jgi:predicted nucleic acid-binding protein